MMKGDSAWVVNTWCNTVYSNVLSYFQILKNGYSPLIASYLFPDFWFIENLDCRITEVFFMFKYIIFVMAYEHIQFYIYFMCCVCLIISKESLRTIIQFLYLLGYTLYIRNI